MCSLLMNILALVLLAAYAPLLLTVGLLALLSPRWPVPRASR